MNLQRRLVHIWARRLLLLRLTVMFTVAIVVAWTAFSVPLMVVPDQSTNETVENVNLIVMYLVLLAAIILAAASGYAAWRDWNSSFIPNHYCHFSVDHNRTKIEERIVNTAVRYNIPILISSETQSNRRHSILNLDDHISCGFIDEDDMMVIKLSV